MNESVVGCPNLTGCHYSKALGMCLEENKLLICFHVP